MINTLDYAKYQKMQQCIIDVLDSGTKVHITGRGGNRTDLTVALHPLTDPDKQTIFENCVADVNIPVGEVFTSPVLAGTNGTLHVSEVFLNGLQYLDLEIVFKDGMIERYNCGNFADEAQNKAYIRDNILMQSLRHFRWASLPSVPIQPHTVWQKNIRLERNFQS